MHIQFHPAVNKQVAFDLAALTGQELFDVNHSPTNAFCSSYFKKRTEERTGLHLGWVVRHTMQTVSSPSLSRHLNLAWTLPLSCNPLSPMDTCWSLLLQLYTSRAHPWCFGQIKKGDESTASWRSASTDIYANKKTGLHLRPHILDWLPHPALAPSLCWSHM